MSGDFRVNAQALMLTYAQCAIPKEEMLVLLNHIMEKKKWILNEYVIAEEKHADGSPHLHCYLKLATKPNIKDPRVFDVQWDGKPFHPSIEGVRSPAAVTRYCKKDGDFIASISVAGKGAVWAEALDPELDEVDPDWEYFWGDGWVRAQVETHLECYEGDLGMSDDDAREQAGIWLGDIADDL